MLSNLTSPYLIYDVLIGSFATLIAGFGTWFIGKRKLKNLPKLLLGGAFPVLCNALIIPLFIVFLYGGAEGYASAGVAYLTFACSLLLTESVWIYGIGTPLYFGLCRLQKTNPSVFL